MLLHGDSIFDQGTEFGRRLDTSSGWRQRAKTRILHAYAWLLDIAIRCVPERRSKASRGIGFSSKVSGAAFACTVEGDRVQIQQVILVLNAMDART